MSNRITQIDQDKELQIVPVEQERSRIDDEHSCDNQDLVELFRRYYEIEINRIEKDYEKNLPTIH